MVKVLRENGIMKVLLEGRIDSGNAAEVEQEIMNQYAVDEGCELCVDASNLEYISSAGLRVLMKLRKLKGEPIEVTEVSPEVYEIFETTGFTELLNVSKKLREVDITGCEKIGQGGNGAIYRIDEDTIVKVYQPWRTKEIIERERDYARNAFVNGVPSVIAYDIVKVGDSLGLVFEMIKSDTLSHAIKNNPQKMVELVDKYVELAKTLHSTEVEEGTFGRVQEVFHSNIDNLTQWCSNEEIALLHSLADEIPEANTLLHNDLHPGNIMLQDDELLLIDMPEMTVGPAICDLVSIYRDMIAAPSGEQSDSIEQSVGLNKELILQIGNMFFMKYTGITNPDELKSFYEKLGLLFAFNVVCVCGSGAERSTQLAPFLMDKLLRGVVIPNEQAIRQLFKMPV